MAGVRTNRVPMGFGVVNVSADWVRETHSELDMVAEAVRSMGDARARRSFRRIESYRATIVDRRETPLGVDPDTAPDGDRIVNEYAWLAVRTRGDPRALIPGTDPPEYSGTGAAVTDFDEPFNGLPSSFEGGDLFAKPAYNLWEFPLPVATPPDEPQAPPHVETGAVVWLHVYTGENGQAVRLFDRTVVGANTQWVKITASLGLQEEYTGEVITIGSAGPLAPLADADELKFFNVREFDPYPMPADAVVSPKPLDIGERVPVWKTNKSVKWGTYVERFDVACPVDPP